MDKDLSNSVKSPFERIKKVNEYGQEFWSARELSEIIGYSEYGKFRPVIVKAMQACKNSGIDSSDHFAQVSDMINIGKGAKRTIEDFELSRYACYLIVQNADPSKEIVALGQTYFAVQTRKQEKFEELNEDDKRLHLRNEMKNHNSKLADAANRAGVVEPLDYAIFQNHGYKGLYGGLDNKGIKTYKDLGLKKDILDHMGSTELAANLFRATQTEEKLNRDKIKGKENANRTHYEVGKKVRDTIKDLGGTMPEDLPVVKSIKEIEREKREGITQKKNYVLKSTESISKVVRSTTSILFDWNIVLDNIKNQGRRTIHAFLVDTKADFSNNKLTIYFSNKNAFSKTIISKPENLKILNDCIVKELQCNNVIIELSEYEEI